LDEAPYKLFGDVVKLASITFLSLAFSYWTIKPWFLTEGKTCCYIHQTFSWGFPTGRSFTAPSIAISTRRFKERSSDGISIRAAPAEKEVKGGKRHVYKKLRQQQHIKWRILG
jgi:hypothetical protein